MSLLTVGLIVAALQPSAAPTKQTQPTTLELTSSVENISSHDQQPFSVELSCKGVAGVPASFRICWAANDRYSVLWSEPMTGSPIALFTDKGFFLFDIVDGTIMTGTGLAPSFSLAASEDKDAIELQFGFKAIEHADLELNLRSFFAEGRETQLKTSENIAQLTYRSSTGGVLNWEFQLDRRPTLSEFRIEKPATQTLFRVSNVQRGNNITYTSFPKTEKLPPPLTNQIAVEVSPQLIRNIMRGVMRSAAGHAAAANPRFRHLRTLPSGTSWEAVEKRAAETSKWWNAVEDESSSSDT